MTTSAQILKPTDREYDDDILYGSRREAIEYIESKKLVNDSEFVIHTIGTYVDKRLQWTLKELTNSDKRIKAMLEEIQIPHPTPIQRTCWPQLHQSKFPFLCVSPPSTGKTFAHLLYIVSQSIGSIPHSKTEELIIGNEVPSQTIIAPTSRPYDPNSVPEVIDHENFDFDSIGKETDDDPNDPWFGNKPDPNDYIKHPKYIIICSSQDRAEMIEQDIERMKIGAYGVRRVTSLKCKNLPPITRSIGIRHSDEKIGIRCTESHLLVATPGALIRGFDLEYLNFSRCEKVIFDDLDLTLQLHNSIVRDIMKLYLSQTAENSRHEKEQPQSDSRKASGYECQMYLFSTKWTDLVKQFMSTIFLQRTVIFGSLVEAALCANIRYDLEFYKDNDSRLNKLIDLIQLHVNGEPLTCEKDKLAIISQTEQGAWKICSALQKEAYRVIYINGEDPKQSLQISRATNNTLKLGKHRPRSGPIYVMSDETVDQVVEFFNEITHLVHFSTSDDMLVYDRRYRLMYKHIADTKVSLKTTIFLGPKLSVRQAKELYDQISRSSSTQKSTKYELRDFISEHSSIICWRWASTGLCRLEKLSREDRFGSFCPDRHSITSKYKEQPDVSNRWPTSGQVRMTITYSVSPSEYYFRFEAHRNMDSPLKQWTKFELSGSEFMAGIQEKLDKLKDTQSCSVPLAEIKKGKIYGIYLQQELRVDRIMLLEQPDIIINIKTKKDVRTSKLTRLHQNLQYSKQCEVLRIDSGVKFTVYLRNIFNLPEELVSLEPQCHRGFHLGFKPTHNEPNWIYKAKKEFNDNVGANNLYSITAWLRLNSNSCFWFENMIVTRKLSNIGEENKFIKFDPHHELLKLGFAERVSTEPSCLNPSERLETLSKWHVTTSNSLAQYAFLRRDRDPLSIFILHPKFDLSLRVRQSDFNQQLIALEEKMRDDYTDNKLIALSYIAVGVYCVARIAEGLHPTTNEKIYTINRCRITRVIPTDSSSLEVAIADLSITPVNQDLAVTKKETQNNFDCLYEVFCLDHGDYEKVEKADLYLANSEYLSLLPFQAIECELADLDENLHSDESLTTKIVNLLYDYSRNESDNLVALKCRFDSKGAIYVYIPAEKKGNYEPLIGLLEREHQIKLCKNDDPDLRKSIFVEDDTLQDAREIREVILNECIKEIIADMVTIELSARGVDVGSSKKSTVRETSDSLRGANTSSLD